MPWRPPWRLRMNARPLTTNAVIAAIASSSHFPQARALSAGLSAVAPGVDRVLLWIDPTDARGRADAIEASGFGRIVTPQELLPPEVVADLRHRYTVPEYCFALKPWLLRKLLDEGSACAVYLDTDMQVYAPLDPVLDALRRHSIVLTPHITVPLPEDDCLPRDMTILRSGAFNLGIVGVANDAEARRFLDWWGAREIRYGYLDPWRGWGADQKWCDLTPALLDRVGILKHPGVNAGYWNLPSRPLSKRGDEWRVADEALVLFHFSGFDPERPGVLSKFQDRIDPSTDPMLSELLSEYAGQRARSARDAAGFAPLPPPAEAVPDADADAGVGAELPPENYAARLSAIPTVVCAEPGELIVLRIAVTNPGPLPLWIARHSDGQRGIGLTFHVRHHASGLLEWDNPRQYCVKPVPPGKTQVVDFRYRVPGDPCRLLLEFDLVHEGIAWFHDRGGTTTAVEILAGVHRGAR